MSLIYAAKKQLSAIQRVATSAIMVRMWDLSREISLNYRSASERHWCLGTGSPAPVDWLISGWSVYVLITAWTRDGWHNLLPMKKNVPSILEYDFHPATAMSAAIK